MSTIASSVILASALKPRTPSEPRQSSGSIGQSVADKPLQWLIVAGVVFYFGGKAIKKLFKSGDETRATSAETSSADNPWAFNNFLIWEKVPKNTKVLTYAEALAKAETVRNALDVIYIEDEDKVVAVFTALPSQIQVAQVAKAFSDNFGKDILTYIQQGAASINIWTTFSRGLSTENYQRVINNVARKPKY
jgi:hypothetical protein